MKVTYHLERNGDSLCAVARIEHQDIVVERGAEVSRESGKTESDLYLEAVFLALREVGPEWDRALQARYA